VGINHHSFRFVRYYITRHFNFSPGGLKNLIKYCLFISLFFLVGCTITKRKYTGGFYVNWHSKAPDARLSSQAKATRFAPNKIVQRNSSSVKTIATQQTEKIAQPKVVKAFKATVEEKKIAKKITTIPVVPTYTVTPENNMHGNNGTASKNISRRGVALAVIFCILGVIGAIIVAVIIASSPFWTGANLPLSQALSDALLPLLFLLASLVFSNIAMAHGYNKGLIACIILDSIFLLILIFSIYS
jgi:ABC-type multidrug transport system fused ATPase/permease subunit